ncbi:MAG: hypothetical protein M3Z26_17465 [Bacteroidota bacterium]|nr:hypothetical protein [Bacteroidota bacterium]
MQNFKNKLYNYETPPPEELWSNIAGDLDNGKLIKLPVLRRKSRFLFYSMTAAASLIIIFVSTYFFNKNKEIKTEANAPAMTSNLPTEKVKDSIALNYKILQTIIHTPPDKKMLSSNYEKQNGQAKKYITIAGPEGQPVKISSKAATLILSADKEFPPKTVWNKKIDRWKQIMLNNTTSPTATSLADVLQLAANTENTE